MIKPEDWIKLEDRKPEVGQKVLMYSIKGDWLLMTYYADFDLDISHWLPLVEPPKPDPFEEWFNRSGIGTAYKSAAKMCWIVAIEYQKKQEEK